MSGADRAGDGVVGESSNGDFREVTVRHDSVLDDGGDSGVGPVEEAVEAMQVLFARAVSSRDAAEPAQCVATFEDRLTSAAGETPDVSAGFDQAPISRNILVHLRRRWLGSLLVALNLAFLFCFRKRGKHPDCGLEGCGG